MVDCRHTKGACSRTANCRKGNTMDYESYFYQSQSLEEAIIEDDTEAERRRQEDEWLDGLIEGRKTAPADKKALTRALTFGLIDMQDEKPVPARHLMMLDDMDAIDSCSGKVYPAKGHGIIWKLASEL
jgi:hypothetical protein